MEEAIAESNRAQESDPLSPTASALAGRTLCFARRFDQAIVQLRRTLEMEPGFLVAHWYLGMAYEQVGAYEAAIAECKKALSISGEPSTLGMLGHVYGVSGNRDEAERVLAELTDLSARQYVDSFDIALVCVGLGENSRALELLERACDDHSLQLLWINVDTRFDRLHGEPRFLNILRRIHLIV